MTKDSLYERNRAKAEELEPLVRSVCQDYPADRPLTRQEHKELSGKRVAVVESIYNYLKNRPVKHRMGEVYGDYAMEIWDALEDGLKPGRQWSGLFFLNFLVLLEKRIGGGVHTNDNADMKRLRVKEALDAVAMRNGFGKSEARKARESFFDKDTILYRSSLERYLRNKISCSEEEIRQFFTDFYDIEYVSSQNAAYEDPSRVAASDKEEEQKFFSRETQVGNDYHDIVKTVRAAFDMAKNNNAKKDLKYCLTLQVMDSISESNSVEKSKDIHDVLEKMSAIDGIPDEITPYIDKEYIIRHYADEGDDNARMEIMAAHLGVQPATWQKRFSVARKFMMKTAAEVCSSRFTESS